MRFLLLSLLFSTSILHAAASSMSVSMESKGVPKAEFRSGTNAVYVACKSERRSSTNAIYQSCQNYPFTFYALTQTPSGESTLTCLPGFNAGASSPITFTTSLNCVILCSGNEDYIIEAFPQNPTVKLSVNAPYGSGPVHEFSITPSGHSTSYVDFVVRVTYQSTIQLNGSFGKSPDYPHARVLLYKFHVQFPPE